MDLVTIAPGHQLSAPAAAAWARAVAAGCPVAITSAYRSAALQARLHRDYLAALARGERVSYVAPVGQSEHVQGNALDLKDPAIGWMRAHPDYGFVFTDASERWHVAYRLGADRHLFDHTPQPQEDDDMPLTQADLEAVDRIVTDRLAQRLAQPILTTQVDKETLDRLIVGRTAQALAPIAANIAATLETLQRVAVGGGIDPVAITAAAEAGAAAALSHLTLKAAQ